MVMGALSFGCSWEWCIGMGVVELVTELIEKGGAKESAMIVEWSEIKGEWG